MDMVGILMHYAVITGSTKGIGKAIAEKFLREGWFVFLNSAQDDMAAEKFRMDNANSRDNFMIIKQKISDFESATKFAYQILQHTNTIDCLVLNAGATDRSK